LFGLRHIIYANFFKTDDFVKSAEDFHHEIQLKLKEGLNISKNHRF